VLAYIAKKSASSHTRFAVELTALLGMAVLLPSRCQAQSQATRTLPLAFEVASVRLTPPNAGLFSISPYGGDTFTARNVTLKVLIELAFGVDSGQIAGEPGWLNSQLYDVSAKVDGKNSLTREALQAPLRQLLEQRFHLTTHRDTKDLSGYALVASKGGLKLQANKGAPQLAYIFSDRLLAQNVSLQTFASLLAAPTGRPVVDHTAIEGMYDFDLHFAPTSANDSTLPSLFTALQDQFGLKLQSQKVPVELLVIDQVNKTPTDN
jgi:uncharacterized protein (TIGR03435 family)